MFAPLWAGLASPEQAAATVAALPRLEREFGLPVVEENRAPFTYQWDYPNAWPPLQHVAIEGLRRYGYGDEARRLASKYVEVVARNFEATGDLWEKYNAVSGSTDVSDEYEMPRMIGWTAGVFLYCLEVLDESAAARPRPSGPYRDS
jgi:alpha,alpha-trehalase